MIKIIQELYYERAACDCCRGDWLERWVVDIDNEKHSSHLYLEDAQTAVLKHLHPDIIIEYAEVESDD